MLFLFHQLIMSSLIVILIDLLKLVGSILLGIDVILHFHFGHLHNLNLNSHPLFHIVVSRNILVFLAID
jgi:hypothetical protein